MTLQTLAISPRLQEPWQIRRKLPCFVLFIRTTQLAGTLRFPRVESSAGFASLGLSPERAWLERICSQKKAPARANRFLPSITNVSFEVFVVLCAHFYPSLLQAFWIFKNMRYVFVCCHFCQLNCFHKRCHAKGALTAPFMSQTQVMPTAENLNGGSLFACDGDCCFLTFCVQGPAQYVSQFYSMQGDYAFDFSTLIRDKQTYDGLSTGPATRTAPTAGADYPFAPNDLDHTGGPIQRSVVINQFGVTPGAIVTEVCGIVLFFLAFLIFIVLQLWPPARMQPAIKAWDPAN